ncbi:MAG: hypothetical protein ACM3PF_05970 [Bacteroidota bacterium]
MKDDLENPEPPRGRIEQARRRIRQGYYDRPEVRRTLATLILHRAVRKSLTTESA